MSYWFVSEKGAEKSARFFQHYSLIYYKILPLPTNIISVIIKSTVLVFVFQTPSMNISHSQNAAENPTDSLHISLYSLTGFISASCIFWSVAQNMVG